MLINAANQEIINTRDVYVHDSIFVDMTFDYHEKKFYFNSKKNNPSGKIYSIIFFNVIEIDMVWCDFWGESHYILDWESVKVENQKLIKKLFTEKNDNNYSNSRLSTEREYMESIITFKSGDHITIACEYVDYKELPN